MFGGRFQSVNYNFRVPEVRESYVFCRRFNIPEREYSGVRATLESGNSRAGMSCATFGRKE
jgi:hypothetical protein